jgi:iron complex outermembrane recepter protein
MARSTSVGIASLVTAFTFAATSAFADSATTSDQLSEIVVTAQKRSESVQDVPIAITVLTGNSLSANKIDVASDLTFLVPGLQYSSLTGYAQPYLRGVGSDFASVGSDPSVATYVDGVYAASSQGVIDNMLGVQRVEVLKGPQGTLYGRNSVGGAINVVTLTPTDDTSADLTVGGGNYSRKEISGYASGAISSKLDAGIYFGYMQQDSFTTLAPGSTSPNSPLEDRQWGARIKLVYTPNDWLKLTGSGEWSVQDSFDAAVVRQIDRNSLANAFGAPEFNERHVVAADAPIRLKNTITAASVREDVDLGWSQILGISAFRNVNSKEAVDFDGTATAIFGAGPTFSNSKQLSQELQLLSPTSSKLQWIGGVYFFRETGNYYPTEENLPILLPLGGSPPILDTFDSESTLSYAGFGQVTVPLDLLSDALTGFRVTAGLRWTKDDKTLYNSSLSGRNPTGPILFTTAFPNEEASWSKATPKLTVDYRIGGTLLYGTFSKGYQSGVFNLGSPALPGPAAPETVTAYEIGSKSDLIAQRVRLNLAAYYYSFKDLQVQTILPGSGGSTEFANAGAALAYGFEGDLTVAVTEGLTFNLAVANETSRYTDYPDFPGYSVNPNGGYNQGVVSVNGNQMERAPKWVGNASMQYEHTVGSMGSAGGQIALYESSGFGWNPQDLVRQDSYHLVNASLFFTTSDRRWRFSLWAKNLTDTFYEQLVTQDTFSIVGSDAPPRTFGGDVTWRFGK